jgi:hypothetical protein
VTGAAWARAGFAAGFCFGALSHFWWVSVHGLFYHFERPAWAVAFWYVLCAFDFLAAGLLLRRPRAGLVVGNAVMAVSVSVNLLVFPSFEHGFNPIAAGLTAFGLLLAACSPWLWRASAVEQKW